MRVLLLLVLLTHAAAADPPPTFAHLHSPRLACLGTTQATTDCIQLSAGYFLDEPTYSKLDVEMKRLQDTETRLTAENTSLRQSAQAWQPGWVTLLSTLAVGVAAGVYIDHKL